MTEEEEYQENLDKVDWGLPGMENFTEQDKMILERCILGGDIVNSVSCLGWALWPTSNKGYYDENHLRRIADFIEIQNKPFWDEYDQWCLEHQDDLLEDVGDFDEIQFD